MKPWKKRELPIYSASQITTYEDCPRKWAWRYVDGIQGEPNEAAEFGTRVHAFLEAWLRDGKVPDSRIPEGLLAHAMIPYLPTHQAVDAKNVERHFVFALGGHKIQGYVDLVVFDETLRLYDHKTTGDFKWALDEDRLPEDVQATIYAAWGMAEYGVEELELQWTYGRRGPGSHVLPVKLSVDKKTIEPRLEKTLDTLNEMDLVFKGIDQGRAIDVPYEADACGKYGGCPHQPLCNLSAKERMRSIMGQGARAEFMQKLRDKKKQQGGSEAATPSSSKGGFGSKAKEEASSKPAGFGSKAKKTSAASSKSGGGGFGSKAKQQVNPPESAESVPAEEAAAVASAPPKKSSKKKPTVKNDDGWTLYVNCLPVKLPDDAADPDDARSLLSKLSGGGAGLSGTLGSLRDELRKNPPKLGVVIDTRQEEQREALGAFMREASVVVHAEATNLGMSLSVHDKT